MREMNEFSLVKVIGSIIGKAKKLLCVPFEMLYQGGNWLRRIIFYYEHSDYDQENIFRRVFNETCEHVIKDLGIKSR